MRGLVFIKILIIFTVVPLLELYILIEAGRTIGLGATVLLVLLTGIAGAWLARSQGTEILRQIQTETAGGRMPATTLLDGALVLVGGLLLLTPGFFTDLLGFSFLAPITRKVWRKGLNVWLQQQIQRGSVTVYRY